MNMRLMRKFDFIETFNTCESPESNRRAAILAEDCGVPTFAGSDSHVSEYIGMACTEIDADIRCNNDLIAAVKSGTKITAGGTERGESKKAKKKEHWIGILSFKLYNRGIAKLISPYRKIKRRTLLRPIVHNNVRHIRRKKNTDIRKYVVRSRYNNDSNKKMSG